MFNQKINHLFSKLRFNKRERDTQSKKVEEGITYLKDRNFIGLINQINDLNIDINERFLERIYENLKSYIDILPNGNLDLTIPQNYPESYYLNILIRELGGRTNTFFDKVNEPLSQDVVTFHFHDYFDESKENTLSKFLSEINRITKDNFNYELISETRYDDNNYEEKTVTIDYAINGEVHKILHTNNYRRGTLLVPLITDELLESIKGTINNGHLLYYSEESIHIIYIEKEEDYLNFIKSTTYYKEI